jgi:ABC-2 type transport system permease protein
MKILLATLEKDLRLLLVDRGQLVALVLMPLAFILPIGFALGGGDGYGMQGQNQRLTLPVANLDGGEAARQLLTTLEDSLWLETNFTPDQVQSLGPTAGPDCAQAGPACDEWAVRSLVESGQRDAGLVIPAGLSQALAAGQPATLTFLYDPAGDSAHRQQLQGVLEGAALQLSLERQVASGIEDLQTALSLAPEALRQAVAGPDEAGSSAEEAPAAIRLVQVQPQGYTQQKTPDTFQQTVPGYTVMFVFFLIGTISSSLIDERRQGTFRRLLQTPANKAAIVGGKLLAGMITGSLQVLILLGVGVLAFHMQIGHHLLELALLSLALVACAVSLGLAASTTRIGGALIPALILAALLGGCMFPTDLMPPFLRFISYAVPHSWALQGYQNLMVRGQSLAQVLPQIGVLLLFAIVFFFLASRRIEYEEW